MRVVRKAVPFLLTVIVCVMGIVWGCLWSDARAAPAQTLEERIRTSSTFKDLPEINRETAVATLGEALRTRQAVGELRMHMLDLVDSDVALAATLRVKLRGAGLEASANSAIQRYLDLPLEQIEPKIRAVAAQIELFERKMGPSPALAPIPDQELIDALGGLRLAQEQLVRLHDLRAQLTDGPAAALARSGGGLTRALADRDRPARLALQLRLDLLRMHEQHQLQLQLLMRGLGKAQFRRELDEANAQWRALQVGAGKLNGQARDLLGQRRALLAGYLASLESGVGTGSRLLAAPPDGRSEDSPLLVEWRSLRGELIRSVTARAQVAGKLLPVLRERNRHLTALLDTVGHDHDVLALMRLLIAAENRLLEGFATHYGRTGPTHGDLGDSAVDLGIALDTLQMLETQVITTVTPLLDALLDTPGKISVSTLAPALRELARLIDAGAQDLTRLATLSASEQGVWQHYDIWMAALMRQRIRFWMRVRGELGAPKPGAASDPLGTALSRLAHARLAGAEYDLEQRAPLLDEYARDPVIRYLYGQGRQQAWAKRAGDADFVRQALREVSLQTGLMGDLRRLGDAGQAARPRAEALIRLVDELALPWVIVKRQGRLDLLVRIADGDFAVHGIDGGVPEIGLASARPQEHKRYLMFAGPTTPISMLAAVGAPATPADTPRLASNVWNGIGNQARRSWLTYAIIGGGGVVAAGAAALIPGAGWVASAAILKATVLAAGCQAWQDINFGGLKGVARSVYTPEQAMRAERNLDYGETGVNVVLATYGLGKGVKGLVDAGEAAQQVRTAEQALARATQRADVVSELTEAQQRGWEVLRNVARTRDAVQAAELGVQYTDGMIKAQRTASNAIEGYQRSASAAQRTLDGLRQAAADNLLRGAGALTGTAEEVLRSGQGASTGEIVGAIGTASGPVKQLLDQLDGDKDGMPDSQDGCPADPAKTTPGLCGCGIPDTDTDSDGMPDCIDKCPADAAKREPGVCGCGKSDQDSDADGTPDCIDKCPQDPGKTDPGVSGCGQRDAQTATTQPGEPDKTSRECSTDQECALGYVCNSQGACVRDPRFEQPDPEPGTQDTPPACAGDSGCAQGQRCVQGRCIKSQSAPDAGTALELFGQRERDRDQERGARGGGAADPSGGGRYTSEGLREEINLLQQSAGGQTTGSGGRPSTTTSTSGGQTSTQTGGTVKPPATQGGDRPGQPVKPPAPPTTGGSGTLQYYLIEAVAAFERRDIVTGVGWQNRGCTLTSWGEVFVRSLTELEADRRKWGETVLGIVKGTNGALNPRLVSSRVVAGPSDTLIKPPVSAGYRIDCDR